MLRDADPPPAVRENLTRDEARARAAVVDEVETRVHLGLEVDEGHFTSRTDLVFTTAGDAELFIDLTAVEVQLARLDGEELPAEAIQPTRLLLGTVPAGEHHLHVEATMAYRHEGKGLHRFVDPSDGRVYLHSQFEPFDAHTVYACFDQPDLKTTFSLEVDAPAGFVVISNTEATTRPGEDAAGTWRFATSQPISTYLTAVVAGQYLGVHDVYDRGDGTEPLPLGLYVRRSLAEHLEADELFTLTRQGLAYFERVFAQLYPFHGSYDQVFVPEFAAGAMENPGCITFSEAYVFRSKVTDTMRERRAETLLHEMAHLWFGDLVTMRWWDDLWLNESFATFMSVLALTQATSYRDAWVSFLDAEKAWAKQQDQLPSTHPVADAMPDVQSVHQNFDGITYAKGASVLRQLVAWVGEEEFLAGCRDYFARHAWGNTELADFLAALERTSGRDLSAWRDEWLLTTGINQLTPELEVDADGRYARLEVVQSSPPPPWSDVPGVQVPAPVLRRHRVGIGVYRRQGEQLVRSDRVELDVRGVRTAVTELVGRPAGELLLVNDGDLTYAKSGLDASSWALLRAELRRLSDPLAEALAWSSAWDLVRDGVLPARDFVALVTANLTDDTPIGVVQRLQLRAVAAAERYADPDVRDRLVHDLLVDAREQLRIAAPGSDQQLAWARHWATCARVDADERADVRRVLDGELVIDGLSVDTDLRWHLVVQLARAGAADDPVIDAELARDDTDLGQRQAATARAARPSPAAKQATWDRLLEDHTLSHTMSRQLWGGFGPIEQAELLAPYVSRYFEVLEQVWAQRTLDWAIAFSAAMFPHHAAGDELLGRVDALLGDDTLPGGEPLPGPLRRVLLEQRDTLARMLTARATDRAAG